MSITIINHCNQNYKLDVERIISNILEKIPPKFLVGLNKVNIYDHGNKKYPSVRYVSASKDLKYSNIEVYMDNPDFGGYSFFPFLSFNILFILSINEHIEKYLKPRSNCKEILSYPPSMANYDWMYFGVWNPLLIVFKGLNYLSVRVKVLQKFLFFLSKKLLRY